jgi:hypothetical protein
VDPAVGRCICRRSKRQNIVLLRIRRQDPGAGLTLYLASTTPLFNEQKS